MSTFTSGIGRGCEGWSSLSLIEATGHHKGCLGIQMLFSLAANQEAEWVQELQAAGLRDAVLLGSNTEKSCLMFPL